jgi:acetyl esterase
MSSKPTPPSAGTAPSPDWEDRRIDLGLAAPLAIRIHGRKGADSDAALAVHFHGGAFISGSPETGATVANWLASAGTVVVSVDYPLAPAQPFPAAIEAGHAALVWAYKQRTKLAGPRARIFVAGEEAGGNLAAALALVARDRQHPPLAGQILLSPMLDPCMGTASLRRSKAGPAGCPLAHGWQEYLRSPCSAEHPYATPGRALRLGGLPPALLLTAEDDPLRDEALAYGRRLQEAGVAFTESVLPGPTGWPITLTDPTAAQGSAGELARARIREFVAPQPVPSACCRAASSLRASISQITRRKP